MPKKEKKKQKKTKNKKEEIKIREIHPEEFESELEEKIGKQEENIDDNQFHEFLQPLTKTSIPILERIQAQEPANLEEDIISTPSTRDSQTGFVINEPKYSAAESPQEERKYETSIETPILKPLETSRNLSRREFLTPTENLIPQNSTQPGIIETEFIEEKIRLPFERRERKYKKTNF